MAIAALAVLGGCAEDPMPTLPRDAGMDARIDVVADAVTQDRRETAVVDASRSDGGLNLQTVQARVFDAHCALSGCHSGDMPTGRMNLDPDRARESLVGAMARGIQCGASGLVRVTPGSPDMSLLVHKIADETPPCGARMPLSRDPLPPELIQLVRDWVDAGAP